MLTRTDLEKKKTKVEFIMTENEKARAKRLEEEGFFYLYRIGKKIYATDAKMEKNRLLQGTDFNKLTDPIMLIDYTVSKPIPEDIKNDI